MLLRAMILIAVIGIGMAIEHKLDSLYVQLEYTNTLLEHRPARP